MHSNSASRSGQGKFANNCCSSASCGKNLEPYLRQSTVQFPPGRPLLLPPPLPSAPVLPVSPSAIPYDMASNQSCLHCPSIRTATSSFHSPRPVVYVYELPYNVRKAICDLLDADNSWRELGGRYMGFNDTQLTLISHALYRSDSPTNQLLTKWESSNAKVAHLYRFLADMKHRRAMFHLRCFVDDKLRLMYDGFDEQPRFDSVDMRLHQTHQSNSQLAMHNSSLKAPTFQHSTLNDIHPDHSPSFFEHIGHRQAMSAKGHSDEERTLVDLNNKKMNYPDGSENRLSKHKLDYLVKIEDFEIPYKELAIATDDFCKDNILGSGGFGTVYIGEWKGTKVAVKKLKGLDNSAQAFTELRVLNCCRIDNILPLYAVALDGPEPCLVYQYMSNGSLEDRLLCKSATCPLSWLQRAKIGEGIARALNFLHTLKGNPFVHGDVKSANILLDAVYEPKLGDFGLARKVEKRGRNKDSLYTHCTVSSVNGTSVYLPNEYLRNKILSPAVDVYSYGIVILEMATGRRAYDGKKLLINSVEDEYSQAQSIRMQSSHTSHPNQLSEQQPSNSGSVHENLMDKRIAHLTDDRHWFNCLLELGRKCAHKIKSKRPLMIQVLEYFNQCKTTDRIHKLCDKKKVSSSFKSNLKSPLELQLWYDFVRKSCGPYLSDAVFENFGAQVTRMIEDIKFSFSDQSNLHLDRLLNSLPQQSSSSVGETDPNQTTENTSSHTGQSPVVISELEPEMRDSAASSSSSSTSAQSLNLPQLLQFMTMSSSNSATSSTSTIEDELSFCGDSATELDQSTSDIDVAPSETNNGSGETPSTAFIPLLTALGFQNDDIDEMVSSSQIELPSQNDSQLTASQ